ncbi:MAG TPA: hypothetical protein VGF77_14435 [Allosphingosinicella sp.]|jgi:hypothetical protein
MAGSGVARHKLLFLEECAACGRRLGVQHGPPLAVLPVPDARHPIAAGEGGAVDLPRNVDPVGGGDRVRIDRANVEEADFEIVQHHILDPGDVDGDGARAVGIKADIIGRHRGREIVRFVILHRLPDRFLAAERLHRSGRCGLGKGRQRREQKGGTGKACKQAHFILPQV